MVATRAEVCGLMRRGVLVWRQGGRCRDRDRGNVCGSLRSYEARRFGVAAGHEVR